MANKILDLFTEKAGAPDLQSEFFGGIIGIAGFIASALVTLIGLVNFNDGAWWLLIIGLALIASFLYMLKDYTQGGLFSYCALCLTKSMISGSMVVLFVGAIFGVVKFAIDINDNQTTRTNIEQEANFKEHPEALIESLVGNSDIHPKFVVSGDHLVVSYDLDPWSLTVSSAKSSFNLHVTKLIPALFARYPDAQVIQVIGRAEFNDLRGNSSRDDAIRITFSRKNSASINWGNVYYGDIPRIADDYWSHPSTNN